MRKQGHHQHSVEHFPHGSNWCGTSQDVVVLVIPCIASENAYIITCTDAITDKSALSVASFLFRLITRHGSPVIIQSDEGREFVNQVNKHLFELSGVQYRTSAAYHPQTNGLDEWFNRTLVNALTKMTRENPVNRSHPVCIKECLQQPYIHCWNGYHTAFLIKYNSRQQKN